MSRSFRKTPICGITTAATEKDDKRRANRAFRQCIRRKLQTGQEPPYSIRAVSDVWFFDKDGKQYLSAKYRDYNIMNK